MHAEEGDVNSAGNDSIDGDEDDDDVVFEFIQSGHSREFLAQIARIENAHGCPPIDQFQACSLVAFPRVILSLTV